MNSSRSSTPVLSIALGALVLLPQFLMGQTSARPLQSSNVLNPNISLIGWLQAETGHRRLPAGEEGPEAFEFHEAEIAIQSVVDPYARADIFIAVAPAEETVELEEGVLNWFRLPFDLGLKVGKMRANFGRHNRVHSPESPFADRPLMHRNFLGQEALAGSGGSLSWHVPVSFIFLELQGELLTAPDGAESPLFDSGKKNDLLSVARTSAYRDITESANVTLGGSFARGPAGLSFDAVTNSTTTLFSRLWGTDLTFRWKNPRRAIYRSFLWQTEVLWSRKENSPNQADSALGLFSHAEFQFARRWRIGSRYDWTETPAGGEAHDQGGLFYLTFTPSEFSLVSLQTRQILYFDGTKENMGFLKITFNVGPHGAHPF